MPIPNTIQLNTFAPDTVDLNTAEGAMYYSVYGKLNQQVLLLPKGYKPEVKVNPYVNSIFKGTQLKSTPFMPAIERVPSEGWVFLALMAIFGLLLWLRNINPRKMFTYLSSLYNRRALGEILNEEEILTSPFSLLLFVVFCLTTSLFTIKAFELLGFEVLRGQHRALVFGALAILLLTVYAFKIIGIRLVGFIFKLQPIATQHAFNVYLLNNILGLLLIPLLAVAYYSTQPYNLIAAYIGLGLFVLFFILRFGKALVIEGVLAPLNLVYLFLYLCTLEILPLLVAIKLVTSNV